MKPPPPLFLLALLCAAAPARARAPIAAPPPNEPRVQLGVFEGTGRACSGRLKITPKRLSWSPPFNACRPTAFTLAERRQEGGDTQWIYQRVGASKRCFYKVVVLQKTAEPDDRTTWNVTGFVSMKAYKAGSNVWLSCPMVKVD
jgi:hypothetical protein